MDVHISAPATEMFVKALLLCLCTAWSAASTTLPPLLERKCLNISQIECAAFFNGVETSNVGSEISLWPTTFPNARNLSLVDALLEFSGFNALFSRLNKNYCSYLLHSFLCIHYFPPCSQTTKDQTPQLVVPCRAVCEDAMEECLDDLYNNYINISRPKHLDCRNFPDESDGSVIVACPSPGKIAY